ncbi:hypothetical protein [Streptomyces sp. H27-S2]|uniref:hypothetical protein n=1 Tax=Streptomyces antarcticus TaxID=2996458 RepID=UPI00226F9DCD|nr:hypothetical protein [Streptomyces sp. H27-S2]MCY0951284.1 hypothetical protein [Streptomyces sp. H27-S2]
MTDHQDRTCGRPTRSGSPCKIRISGSDVACGTHATEQDKAVAEAHRRGWSEGYRSGSESSTSFSKSRVERLEHRVKELEEQLDATRRVYQVDGHQVVEVGRYSYRWRGSEPLEVGDRVLLPENYVSRMKDGPGPTAGVVSKLGTTYRGQLSDIVRRAPATGK